MNDFDHNSPVFSSYWHLFLYHFLSGTSLAVLLLLFLSGCFYTQQVPIEPETRRDNLEININAENPVVVEYEDRYYLFHSDRGIATWTSRDRNNWIRQNPVFDTIPGWITEKAGEQNYQLSAAEIVQSNGRYYLYYTARADSTEDIFYGLASNRTLNPRSEEFEWRDQGDVFPNKSEIDTRSIRHLSFTQAGQNANWLILNDRSETISIIQLTDSLMIPDGSNSDSNTYEIASLSNAHSDRNEAYRCPDESLESIDADINTVGYEKPVLIEKDNSYYLFLTVSKTCRDNAVYTSYITGRAKSITGPYVDRNGARIDNGGGSQFITGLEDKHPFYINSIRNFDGTDYVIGHTMNTETSRATLLMLELSWSEDGWPQVVVDQL